jgi:carbon storage regulator
VLVIRRRFGEILLIGDGVEIEILECSHSGVKLGIRAPKEITVLRKEIFLTGQQNRLAARQVFPVNFDQLLNYLR